MPSSTLPIRSPRSSDADLSWKAPHSRIRCCPPIAWCPTTSRWAPTCGCWSSRARTCRGRARCSARSGSTSSWRWRALPCARGGWRCPPVALGATLRIQDSLQTGKSRFFAEITRLQADRRPGQRVNPGAVPARRAAGGHQLARPPARRSGHRAGPGGQRRDRPGDDPRPGAGRGRLGPRRARAQRALQRHVRRRADALRLPHAGGRRADQQRAGPDAIDRVGIDDDR